MIEHARRPVSATVKSPGSRRRVCPPRFRVHMIVILVLLATFSTDAFAYLDPGTGSILLQGLIAGVAAVMTFLSVYWQRTKALLKSLFRRPSPPPSDDDQAPR